MNINKNTNLRDVKNSIEKKLVIYFLLICTFSGMILASLYYYHSKKHIWSLFSRISTSCAISAANILYDAPINDILNNEKQDRYNYYLDSLKNIAESFELKYIYVYVPDLKNDRLIPVAGIDGKTGKQIENFNLGEAPENLKLNDTVINMYKNGEKKLELEINNSYGHVLTGYSTVFDKNNKPIAIVGADIEYNFLIVKLLKECSIIFIFIFFSLFLLYSAGIFYINKTLIRPIVHLATDLTKYFGKDTRNSASISSDPDDELNLIADLCNGMALEKKRIDNELNIAKKIQFSSLPMVFPPYPNSKEFEIFADITTAKEVGGDFYDFFYAGPEQFVFLIADVCGKGIPAALFMMQAKSLTENILQTGMPIEEAITKVNKQIFDNNKESYFVTALIASINLRTGAITFVNAGHNYPLIKRANGTFEYFNTENNIVLGVIDGYKYIKTEAKLNKDDMLLFYTDGVTEAMNESEALYGEERLQNVLNKNKDNIPEEIIKKLNTDIKEFCGKTEQSDDITTLIFKFNG